MSVFMSALRVLGFKGFDSLVFALSFSITSTNHGSLSLHLSICSQSKVQSLHFI